MRVRLFVLATLASLSVQAQTTPITLDQAMANPDWIGTPVEKAWWAWDSQNLQYTQKRTGSPIRDIFVVGRAGGNARKVEAAEIANQDGENLVFDARHQQALFVRNGDVFLRNLKTGSLLQITRSNETEADARFSADGTAVLYRGDENQWFRWSLDSHLLEPAALPVAENDPNKAPKADDFRDMQLRLISTLKRIKNDRDELKAKSEADRKADATRAIAKSYLGSDIQIDWTSLSPAGQWLLAVTSAKGADEGRVGKLPKYVTESGYEEFEDERTRVGRNSPTPQSLKLVNPRTGAVLDISLDGLPGIAIDPMAEFRKAQKLDALKGNRPVRIDVAQFNDAGTQVAVMLRAIDNKDRWIATVDFANGKLVSQHRLNDKAWINWNFNDFGWLDNDTLWYLSEESGYSHLYAQKLGAKATALTSGKWEASSPVWSSDKATAYVLCNRAWPGDYEVCAVNRNGVLREVTALDGVEDFSLSPDGNTLLVRYSGSYLPAQVATVGISDGAMVKLTDTRTPEFKARNWIAPEFVQVPSKHGAGKIWAKFYKPANYEAGKKYPIVMFVHGAGYLQNVHAHYPAYFREQMFNNMLVQKGYIVLDMDYRASEGYGRDWRTAIYRQMGHPELEDYLDGLDWLVENQQGDRAQVGIYGGSYGGFMSFMALFRAPEAFKAGAALRPVSDWTSYNHEYTSNILNTPQLDPEAYKISSPIEYVENLRGNLLISHGMMDDNVFYQDSVRLSQRLIELKKDKWEMASYPLERHGYVHPESWYDQYRRIYELFERTLKQ
ncbi:MAG TPA: prolyl oligopeptidase family serine peptidase [Arenimonas sp.]|nr:prolyl oligopeptidase family serine peptidase [Arenimonas sp.]HOZ03998.1 prolyl oligopeptidase family serine peptidase [Arenimonas sp.]HPO24434.1 prolyl oligopeptidase family serine peptidase [Arenimonas sp.]HPW31899.1 prolyl oligopeptidase family serine peptidase [Arenimonas sp.]